MISPNRRQVRGAATIYFLLFATLFFGFLVFATDFGRMYLIQGELQTAADAAALAAATQLAGTIGSTENANDQMTASFDSTTGNDNRFNLRLNQIALNGGSGLATTVTTDYFAALLDAIGNVNGGQSGGINWSSGIYPKYVGVQITAQAPVLFLPLLTGVFGALPNVTARSIAGISAPICSACGIDGLAAVDLSGGSDPLNFGFTQGAFYTLYRSGVTVAAPTDGTSLAPYVALNHIPNGPQGLDADATLYEIAAGGLSSAANLTPPGVIPIGSVETLYTGATTPGPDTLCGLNVRFAVDPSATPNCSTVDSGEFETLSAYFTADTDLGGTVSTGLQDFATQYDGNFRRVITLTVVDGAASLNVLNFRQFLVEPAAPTATVSQGLNTTLASGEFRAQYIGAIVPVHCGSIGGVCQITSGIGRTVLH